VRPELKMPSALKSLNRLWELVVPAAGTLYSLFLMKSTPGRNKRLSYCSPTLSDRYFLWIYTFNLTSGCLPNSIVFFRVLRWLFRRFHDAMVLCQDWFLNFSFFGTEMRDLFSNENPIYPLWPCGLVFIRLVRHSNDDGVVVAFISKGKFRIQ